MQQFSKGQKVKFRNGLKISKDMEHQKIFVIDEIRNVPQKFQKGTGHNQWAVLKGFEIHECGFKKGDARLISCYLFEEA